MPSVSSLNTSLAHIYVMLYSALKSARTNITCYTASKVTVWINGTAAKIRDVNVLRMGFPGKMGDYLFWKVLLRSRNSPILWHAIPWLPKQVVLTEGNWSWLFWRMSQTSTLLHVVINFMYCYIQSLFSS